MSQIMIGDTVRRTDEDWGEGRVIGVVVDPNLDIEFQVSWPDGPVVGWVPPSKLELVSTCESVGTDDA